MMDGNTEIARAEDAKSTSAGSDILHFPTLTSLAFPLLSFNKKMDKQQHKYEDCKIDGYHHGKRQFIQRKVI
jgi:hypothetical protein